MKTGLAVDGDRYLLLYLTEGQLIMLAIDQLAEIFNLSLAQVVPIPDVPRHVMGVCNWRGDIPWLIDVGLWLGLPALYHKGFGQTVYKVVLLQAQGQFLGMVVPKIGEMLSCQPAQIQPINFPLTNNFAQSCRGYLVHQGQTVLALDSNQIVEAMTNG